MLYDAIQTGFLFTNTDDSYGLEGVLICVPLGLTILWSILRHRYIWIGSVLCLIGCIAANGQLGEITTPAHVPLFVASVAVPYLLCAYGILFNKPKRKQRSVSSYPVSAPSSANDVSSDYSSSYGSSSDTYDTFPEPTLSSTEKWDYIQNNCDGEYSYGAMARIDNDPNLTPSQKEDLKRYLTVYGD